MKANIQTIATVFSDNLKLSIGDGYTTLSLAPAHTQSIMLKTSMLEELVQLANHGKDVWARAKQLEKEANVQS